MDQFRFTNHTLLFSARVGEPVQVRLAWERQMKIVCPKSGEVYWWLATQDNEAA